jgi:hypothetical protein
MFGTFVPRASGWRANGWASKWGGEHVEREQKGRRASGSRASGGEQMGREQVGGGLVEKCSTFWIGFSSTKSSSQLARLFSGVRKHWASLPPETTYVKRGSVWKKVVKIL